MKKRRSKLRHNASRELADEAENLVMDNMKQLDLSLESYMQKRIPDVSRMRGFGEADVISITRCAIFAIEVKNWSGSIDIVDGNLTQAHRTPSTRNIFEHIENKAKNIGFCYSSLHGKRLDNVKPLIVIANENAVLSPSTENHPMVVKLSDLSEKIYQMTKKCDQYTDIEISNVLQMIDKFPTWDRVKYADSTSDIGDLDEEHLPYGISRNEVTELDIAFPRGLFSTVLFGPQVKITKTTLDGDLIEDLHDPQGQTLTIHTPSTNNQTKELDLLDLSSIFFGYNETFDWQNFTKVKVDSSEKEASHNYEVGEIYSGRIHKEYDHAFLIILVERRLSGLLYKSSIGYQSWMKELYAKNKMIEVRIKQFSNDEKTQCVLEQV